MMKAQGPYPCSSQSQYLGGDEPVALGGAEAAAGERHVASHAGMIHELDDGRLVHLTESDEKDGRAMVL